MVMELAIRHARPGSGPGIESAFNKARPLLDAATGHLRHSLVAAMDERGATSISC